MGACPPTGSYSGWGRGPRRGHLRSGHLRPGRAVGRHDHRSSAMLHSASSSIGSIRQRLKAHRYALSAVTRWRSVSISSRRYRGPVSATARGLALRRRRQPHGRPDVMREGVVEDRGRHRPTLPARAAADLAPDEAESPLRSDAPSVHRYETREDPYGFATYQTPPETVAVGLARRRVARVVVERAALVGHLASPAPAERGELAGHARATGDHRAGRDVGSGGQLSAHPPLQAGAVRRDPTSGCTASPVRAHEDLAKARRARLHDERRRLGGRLRRGPGRRPGGGLRRRRRVARVVAARSLRRRWARGVRTGARGVHAGTARRRRSGSRPRRGSTRPPAPQTGSPTPTYRRRGTPAPRPRGRRSQRGEQSGG